jgi:hypothetical protein
MRTLQTVVTVLSVVTVLTFIFASVISTVDSAIVVRIGESSLPPSRAHPYAECTNMGTGESFYIHRISAVWLYVSFCYIILSTLAIALIVALDVCAARHRSSLLLADKRLREFS